MKEINQSHFTFHDAESGDIFMRSFVRSNKIREVIREEKMEKTEARKEVNVELFIVE